VAAPETKSALRVDHAWSALSVALAKTAPRKLHTGTLAAVHIRALRRRY
jgi:hypothetical protein